MPKKPDQHRYRLMRPHAYLADKLPGPYPGSINAAVARYLYLVSNPPKFTNAEWGILRRVCRNWVAYQEPPNNLKKVLVSKIANSDAPPYLVEKIASLSETEAIAVVYTIEYKQSIWRHKNDY